MSGGFFYNVERIISHLNSFFLFVQKMIERTQLGQSLDDERIDQ